MKRDEIRKLLGGYATGTLTDAERKALFEAAMDDQALFDAIAGEHVLKEALDDPQARAYLIAALPAAPAPIAKPVRVWSWEAVASLAATLVIGVLLLRAPVPPKLTTPHTMAARPMNAELQAPAAFKAEQEPQLAKQKKSAPAVALSSRANAEALLSATPAPSPLQSDRESRLVAESDAKSPPKREPAAPATVAEIRKKVDLPVSADAVQSRSGVAAQSPVSNAVSTPVAGPLSLLDRAVQTQQSARQLFYSPVYSTGVAAGFVAGRYDTPPAAKLAAVQPAGTPGLRYTLLRRQPDGSYVETDPATIFRAGDAVRLSIETNSSGYLAVWNGREPVANVSVLARTKYTVPAEGAIDLTGPPSDRKLLVIFSRAAQAKPAGLVGGLLVEQSGERATYVADPRPSALVSFEIRLTYR